MRGKTNTLLPLQDEYKALGFDDLIKPVFDLINVVSDPIKRCCQT